jgi:hypothetical protein
VGYFPSSSSCSSSSSPSSITLDSLRSSPPIYSLFAAVLHLGSSMFSGHYTAYAKNPFTKKWYFVLFICVILLFFVFYLFIFIFFLLGITIQIQWYLKLVTVRLFQKFNRIVMPMCCSTGDKGWNGTRKM